MTQKHSQSSLFADVSKFQPTLAPYSPDSKQNSPLGTGQLNPSLFKTPERTNAQSVTNFDSCSSKSDYMSDSEYKRRLGLRIRENNCLIPPNKQFQWFIQVWFSKTPFSDISSVCDEYFRRYGKKSKQLKQARCDNIFEMSEAELAKRTHELRRRGILDETHDDEDYFKQSRPKYKKRRSSSARIEEETRATSRRESIFTEPFI